MSPGLCPKDILTVLRQGQALPLRKECLGPAFSPRVFDESRVEKRTQVYQLLVFMLSETLSYLMPTQSCKGDIFSREEEEKWGRSLSSGIGCG